MVEDAGKVRPEQTTFPVIGLNKVDGQRPLPVSNPAEVRRHDPVQVYCAACGKPSMRRPSSRPFQSGPYKGGYLCVDCVVLQADADGTCKSPEARRNIEQEAERIRLERAHKGELLHEDPEVTAWLTPRGTVLVDLKRLPFGGAEEFDPARFQALMRAFTSVRKALPGYEITEASS